MAADVARDVHRAHVLLRELEGGEHRPLGAADAHAGRARGQGTAHGLGHVGAALRIALQPGAGRRQRSGIDGQVLLDEARQALRHHLGRVLAGAGQQVLAVQRGGDAGAAQQRGEFLLDVLGLAFLDHQHGALALAEALELLGHQRARHVEHQHRDPGFAEGVGQTELLQRPDEGVVEAALHDEAEVLVLTVEQLVQGVLGDVAARGGDTLLALELLVAEGHGRVRQAHVVEAGGLLDQLARGDGWRDVVLGVEAAAHVAGADAQLHDGRHVRSLGEAKAVLDHVHHARQIGPRVEQEHAALERVGVRAFLDHAGAFAVVLAHHDQHAARDAGRGEVGQRVGRHVGADDGLPGDGAAHGVVDGGAQHGRGRGLVGAGLHVHAQGVEVGLGLHHHVQQVRDRRALIAPHVGNARLQQALGDGEDALAMESLASAELKGLDLLAE